MTRLVLALALIGALGCAKSAGSVGNVGDYTYGNYPGGGESYAEGDYVTDGLEVSARQAAAPPPMREEESPASDAKKQKGKGRGEFRNAKEAPKAPDDPLDPTSTPVTTDTTTTTGETQPEPPAQDEDQDDRQIIYTASLQLAVYELDQAIAFAEDIPNRHGGWIQARYDYQITLRVPAEKLARIIVELSELGLVLGKTLQADDVTDQYTDLESRIAVLEQLHAQLEILLKQAKTVEDSLKVRQELERVRIELESARVQMRSLAESISFSTLTIHLSPRGPVESLPSTNDPFPWVDDLGVETTEFR